MPAHIREILSEFPIIASARRGGGQVAAAACLSVIKITHNVVNGF